MKRLKSFKRRTPLATAPSDLTPLDIAHYFTSLPDPRHPAFRDYHLLSDILVIALSAILSGAKSWDAIAAFGRTKEPWLRSLGLSLPHGIPAHDTFNRIFAALDPLAFQRCFHGWIDAIGQALGWRHIPIDGKTVRGSRGPDGTCLHLVSAWAVPQRLTRAQVAVHDKSNEITAIPELLALLQLRGALVSIDALGCQKDIAQQIRNQGGDYLLGLKDNQPTLKAAVEARFLQAYETDFAGLKHDLFRTEEVGHGRHEERAYRVLYQPSGLSTADEWVDLKAVVQVIRTRRPLDATVTAGDFWVRLEHQLLLKLPVICSVLFAIRVEVVPLWRVLESPAVAARLALLLETMPVAAAEYKGVIGARDVIVLILRSVQLAEQ